jgi:hypothetical protein
MRIPIRLKLTNAALPVAALVVLVTLVGAPPAVADQPVWNARAIAAPESLPPGGRGEVLVTVTNLGDMAAAASGTEPITISIKLPEGLKATAISNVERATEGVFERPRGVACELASLTCEATGGRLLMYASMEIAIQVAVEPTAKNGLPVQMSVSGGGAAPVSASDPVTVSATPTKFGVERFEVLPLNADGSLDTQAGSHPFQLTTTITFNQTAAEVKREEYRLAEEEGILEPGDRIPEPLAATKDQTFSLAPGLSGNPAAVPQCPLREFQSHSGEESHCPADTAVGVVSVAVNYRGTQYKGLRDGQPGEVIAPVYNLEPAVGEPARFGFTILALSTITAYLDTSVRTGGDYGVDVSIHNVNQDVWVVGAQLSLWGVPGDPRHDLARGRCVDLDEINAPDGCTETGAVKEAPFLTLPVSCSGPSDSLTSTVEATTWLQPTVAVPSTYALHDSTGNPVGLDGCDRLPFDPSISVAPDGEAANAPTGLMVRLKVPQEAGEAPEGVAESDVRNTTVTLPAGLQVNPAAAGGLEACTEADIGFERYDETTEQSFFHEETEQERQGLVSHQECPEGSKLGTVKITTPLLSEPLEGSVYQAAQGANPFGSLLALYVVAEDKKAGVRVRLAGKIEANPTTGQLTSTFDQTPQLPFEEFDLKFFGGPKAPLATSSCGAYRTDTAIEPWSGEQSASPFSEFDVTTGPNGTPCSSLGSFAPAFLSGTANNDAGAFSPFTMTLSRKDGEQTLGTVAMTMPPGLLGMLSKVALCDEAQANAGACPAASQIGHVTVQAGVGNEPITLPEAGKQEDPVYLTGPYEGAPFGLAIVVHPEAGPFNLEENGRPVIVRAKIEINPSTAQVSIASNPMPTRLRGIPLDVRTVNVTIDREGFMFNPTNCEPLTVAGTIGSSEGASESVSSHLEAANCATLPFAPKLTASVAGHGSKASGTTFDVKLQSAGLGQANIHKVDLTLPTALPSRLSTLQKACLAAVFESNPASCSPESIIGKATIHTPVLNSPLSGPAYLVSHGGAAFPDVEFVLQGEGVELILDGKTDIKDGITYSKFETAPDAPFTTFETELPAGPKSIFGVYQKNGSYNLCGTTLQMPTEITGQNGAVIKQTTAIAATGCPPKLSITKTKVKGNTVLVTVKLGEAGTVKITGKGLKTTTKKGVKAGTHTITVLLTNSGRAAKKHKKKLKIQATLAVAGRTGTATTTLMA